MDRFIEYGLRSDADEQIRRAFRDAFQRAGLSRAQLGQAMDWYKERGQHLGGDVAKLTESFGEFAVEKGWASQHLEAAVSVYGQISEQGPAAVLAPAPSPEDDAATIKRADELLRTNPDAYWRDFELQEAVFEARAPGGRAGDGTGGGRLRHRAPHRPTRLRQVRRDAPDDLGGLVDQLPSLRTGEGVFLGEVMPIPSRVRVRKAKQKPVGDDPKLPDVWQTPNRPDGALYTQALANWRAQSTSAEIEDNQEEEGGADNA
jgi:hypothetical protein